MSPKSHEVTAHAAACSPGELTFEEFLRTQVDAAKTALDSGTEEEDDCEPATEELIIDLAEEKLPEIRSDYELLGFIYFQVSYQDWDPAYYVAAEDLWGRYEDARDKISN